MSWFTYLQRTSLAQIRADLTEYMKLLKKCAILSKLQDRAYDNLIKIVSYDSKNAPLHSCIRQTYCFGNSHFKFGGSHMADETLLVAQSTCKNFDENGDGVKCEKSDCPFVAHNHKYVEMRERYNLMRQARSDFWRVKFEQASQNIK